MSTVPPARTTRRSNRRLVMIVVLAVLAMVAVGLVVAYLFFFGSEAPPAPTLDNALQVLLPSPSPR